MTGITTHVLDTARGRPAEGIAVSLEIETAGSWRKLGAGTTDADGRVRDLLAGGGAEPGHYRLRFETGAYHQAAGVNGFYPYVAIVFEVRDPSQHHHVPLLLSPFGYSTYRGS